MEGSFAILVFISILLAGCVSNDTIINDTKKCHDAGMYAGQALDHSIVCEPKENR